MLCALAYICVFILKFKVGFLTFDFKDAVISIISFLYGPLYGVFSAGIVAFMEFITISDTGAYGLIMNFLSIRRYFIDSIIFFIERIGNEKSVRIFLTKNSIKFDSCKIFSKTVTSKMT